MATRDGDTRLSVLRFCVACLFTSLTILSSYLLPVLPSCCLTSYMSYSLRALHFLAVTCSPLYNSTSHKKYTTANAVNPMNKVAREYTFSMVFISRPENLLITQK